MKKHPLIKMFILFLCLISGGKIFAQLGVNANGAAPDSNAMLDISSTTKGLLIPRMTTTERTALTHTQGLTVFDITTNGYWYSNGTAWINLATISSASWLSLGNNIYNNNTGNVGIGTNNPVAPLNIYNPAGALTLYQTSNTGSLMTDGFLTGIANIGLSAFVMNYENGPLILGTNSVTRIKIEGNGKVGIGTATPLSLLHVKDGSVLFSGLDYFSGNPAKPPISGKGTRTFWYAEKSAFRTGGVYNYNIFGFPDADTTNFHNWDRDSIGVFSFASGFNTKARGDFSVAMGEKSYALGNSATALGNGNIAKGNFSITAGSNNIAEGESSTAFGNGTKASGIFSFASGEFSRSSGNYSTTFGSNTEASGTFSTAFGNSTTASGTNSTAMGRNANTNNHTSTFCIAGVGGNLITSNTADNQMMMRFDNYTFFVGSDPFTNYAFLVNATNGWQHTSDIRKKENFLELNGETVLKKIAKIPFYSWNFKGKEMKEYRHYGIMAQDFYHSFGKDDLGIIGNDTTVSALDLLGVAYSGIKALEKRTQDLQIQNEFLFHEIAALKALIQPKRNKYTLKKSHPAKKEELFTVK